MKTKLKILGLMSGTSLDGLDMALCEFSGAAERHKFKIIATKTMAYDAQMTQMLATAIKDPATSLLEKHQVYGQWLGEKAKAFLSERKLDCDAIASHGHTIHHQPEKGYTFQLGAGQAIANTAKLPVISDFRSIDVSLGGQGAPLVPIGDLQLFAPYKYCLNLGGISNISIKEKEGIIAYDIGLANILLNYLAAKNGKNYDAGGEIAATGRLNLALFNSLNGLAYHQLKGPKSLGVEFFNTQVKPLLTLENLSVADALYTGVQHIAFQIKQALILHPCANERMLVTGGGAKNTFLMNSIKAHCQEMVSVVIPKEQMVDFKEAIVFAYMGWLHLENKPNCLKAVTGAAKDHIGGYLFKPQSL